MHCCKCHNSDDFDNNNNNNITTIELATADEGSNAGEGVIDGSCLKASASCSSVQGSNSSWREDCEVPQHQEAVSFDTEFTTVDSSEDLILLVSDSSSTSSNSSCRTTTVAQDEALFWPSSAFASKPQVDTLHNDSQQQQDTTWQVCEFPTTTPAKSDNSATTSGSKPKQKKQRPLRIQDLTIRLDEDSDRDSKSINNNNNTKQWPFDIRSPCRWKGATRKSKHHPNLFADFTAKLTLLPDSARTKGSVRSATPSCKEELLFNSSVDVNTTPVPLITKRATTATKESVLVSVSVSVPMVVTAAPSFDKTMEVESSWNDTEEDDDENDDEDSTIRSSKMEDNSLDSDSDSEYGDSFADDGDDDHNKAVVAYNFSDTDDESSTMNYMGKQHFGNAGPYGNKYAASRSTTAAVTPYGSSTDDDEESTEEDNDDDDDDSVILLQDDDEDDNVVVVAAGADEKVGESDNVSSSDKQPDEAIIIADKAAISVHFTQEMADNKKAVEGTVTKTKAKVERRRSTKQVSPEKVKSSAVKTSSDESNKYADDTKKQRVKRRTSTKSERRPSGRDSEKKEVRSSSKDGIGTSASSSGTAVKSSREKTRRKSAKSSDNVEKRRSGKSGQSKEKTESRKRDKVATDDAKVRPKTEETVSVSIVEKQDTALETKNNEDVNAGGTGLFQSKRLSQSSSVKAAAAVIQEGSSNHDVDEGTSPLQQAYPTSQQPRRRLSSSGSNAVTNTKTPITRSVSRKSSSIIKSAASLFSFSSKPSKRNKQKNEMLAASYHGGTCLPSSTASSKSLKGIELSQSSHVDSRKSSGVSLSGMSKVEKTKRSSGSSNGQGTTGLAESCHGQLEGYAHSSAKRKLNNVSVGVNNTRSRSGGDKTADNAKPKTIVEDSSMNGSMTGGDTMQDFSNNSASESKVSSVEKQETKLREDVRDADRSQDEIVLQPVTSAAAVGRQPVVSNPVSYTRRAPSRTRSSDNMELNTLQANGGARRARTRRPGNDLNVSSMHGTSSVSRVRRSKRSDKAKGTADNAGESLVKADKTGSCHVTSLTTSESMQSKKTKTDSVAVVDSSVSDKVTQDKAARKASPRRGTLQRAMSTQNVKRPEEYIPSRKTSRMTSGRLRRERSMGTSQHEEPATQSDHAESVQNSTRKRDGRSKATTSSGISQSEHLPSRANKSGKNRELDTSRNSRMRDSSVVASRSSSALRRRSSSVVPVTNSTRTSDVTGDGEIDTSKKSDVKAKTATSRQKMEAQVDGNGEESLNVSRRGRKSRESASLSRQARSDKQSEKNEDKARRSKGFKAEGNDEDEGAMVDFGKTSSHHDNSKMKSSSAVSSSNDVSATDATQSTTEASEGSSSNWRSPRSQVRRKSEDQTSIAEPADGKARKRSASEPRRDLLVLMREQKVVTKADLMDKENRRLLHFLLYEHKMDVSLKGLQKAIRKERESDTGLTLGRRRLPLMMSDT